MFGLDTLGLSAATVVLAAAITFLGGFAKGVVGFAMPLIMFTGLSTIMPIELALAALILPTVFTNVFQAFRDGLDAMVAICRAQWRFLLILSISLAIGAQLVTLLPQQTLLLVLGIPVTGFAVLQLVGWTFRVTERSRRPTEVITAIVAGTFGGMAGTWGPPTVTYLTAINLPKSEMIRVQGVIYGFGAVVLFFAHIRSGVLTGQTSVLSLAMLLPALAGMALGVMVQDRMNQATFRKATLVVLIVAGLNLVRRGLMG